MLRSIVARRRFLHILVNAPRDKWSRYVTSGSRSIRFASTSSAKTTTNGASRKSDNKKSVAASSPFITSKFHPGPSLRLGTGHIANLTESSVVGTCGNTVVLAAVSADHASENQFFTVEYKQRTAAVGVFPQNGRRSDSGRPTDSEILAGRAIDRAIRPLLAPYHAEHGTVAHYHVAVTVQATEGSAVAVALNTAVAAVAPALMAPVAATVLTVYTDGSVVQGGGLTGNAGTDDEDMEAMKENGVVGELLYAGTRDRAVMMEWTSRLAIPLPEDELNRLLQLAQASIQPTLDTIDELQRMRQKEPLFDDDAKVALREALGLEALEQNGEETKPDGESKDSKEATAQSDESVQPTTMLELMEYRDQLLKKVVEHLREKLGASLHRLFGYIDDPDLKRDKNSSAVHVHMSSDELPLSKRYRGQREQVMQEEIRRLVDEYLEQSGIKFCAAEENVEPDEVGSPGEDATKDSDQLHLKEGDRSWIQEQTIYKLLRRALWETASKYGTRSDQRLGRRSKAGQAWKTIRPLNLTIPALPDSVHGSALFARGDTQVLCTTTLGAPSDGPTLNDPFDTPVKQPDLSQLVDEDDPDQPPIGSLRFLRTQEAMESDLNSRKVKADKERTGESGTLAEVKRAFLQYDFPAYSTGVISRRAGIDRRAIGHGSLAERAILPVLPEPEAFPYSIRMTSEVTDSNGSSSMASVCGATLALLDAGVPIKDSVAGVSVGLAVKNDDVDYSGTSPKGESDEFSLLLDITGTEDHYGGMDFKVAGTRDGVTAIQLDVKRPVPQQVLFDALGLASLGRKKILDAMDKEIRGTFNGASRRHEPKPKAPRVEVVEFDPNRKRDLIGPGGVVLRQLEERYGVEMDLTQEGKCILFGLERTMVQKARATIMDLVSDVVEGEVYTGTVIELKDYGAIVELLRNKEGLLHASELTLDNTEMKQHPDGIAGFVQKELTVGQKIEVLCVGVDAVQGSVRLSRKALLERKQNEDSI